MEHNLPLYRSNMLLSDSYAASPGFLPTLGWGSGKVGHVLITRETGENAIISVVGRVLEKRLNCGPTGNFRKEVYGGLEAAKFHLLLGKPTDTPFADDFDKTVASLREVQGEIASTPEHVNLIVVDRQETELRFTRNVFEKRKRALIDDGSPGNAIDNETKNWPIPTDLRDDLDNIKQRYCAVPLPVFVKDRFIEAHDVNEVIRGALVEIHIELNHYYIRPKKQDPFDGIIKQITVLQPGEARPFSVYKRKNEQP